MARFGLVLLIGVIGFGGWYWWDSRHLSDDVLAVVDGEPLPYKSVQVLHQYAQKRQPEITLQQVLAGIIENRVLAEHAAHKHGHEHGHHEGGSGKVDYSPETLFENEQFKVFRNVFVDQINVALRASGSDNPLDFLEVPLNLDEAALAPMLSVDSLLYHEMTEEQADAAKTYVLGSYRFPGGEPQDLTLWDVYSRQNIQLKVQMHEMNLAFIEQAVRQFLATQFVLDWVKNHSGLNAEEQAGLTMMVADRMEKEELMHEMGLMHDIHDDNPLLTALAKEVTQEQIKAYYDANKDQFTRVEKVKARHIRLDSQEKADQLYADIKAGKISFDQAVIELSVAEDKNIEVPGDLGWIDRDNRHSNWLMGLAFIQPKGVASPPFRSPQNEDVIYWEILHLDEKVMGYQPWDSEGVRYEASKAIAKELIQTRFQELRNELMGSAKIRINPTYIEDNEASQ